MSKPVGEIIKEQREFRGMTKTIFAKKLHCTPQNIDSIERRKSIDFELAQRISLVLEFDIFQSYRVENSELSKKEEILQTKLNDLTLKYTVLLEKYNLLLENRVNSMSI